MDPAARASRRVSAHRKIVVEAFVRAPVEEVWRRTQEPAEHVRWDLRFDEIAYVDGVDERGFHAMEYRTSIGFGVAIHGVGRYRHSTPLAHSSFEFDSSDWKSLIRGGTGLWLYEPIAGGTYFKTVFDYEPRFWIAGALVDRFLFRPMFRLATEWSFETLRLWCEGDASAPARRRSRAKFLAFVVHGTSAGAKSWLGSGREASRIAQVVATAPSSTRAPSR